MNSILLTGIATLDIINRLQRFPDEDSEVRALSQQVRSGGNAANAANVLKQLGFNAFLLSNMADDGNANVIFSLLHEQGINTSLCTVQKNSSTPTSYISTSQQNASRTIIHHRQLNELDARHFLQLDLSHYDWLHFEARNCQQLRTMLEYAKTYNKPISIELEKPRDKLEGIADFADLLFISKPFAESQSMHTATHCIEHFNRLYPDKIITCTWGEKGAWASYQTQIIHQPAFKVEPIIETLGVGDTFNAGFIRSQLKQLNIADSLAFACRLAASKCAQAGFERLAN